MNKPTKIAIIVLAVLLILNFTKNMIVQAAIEGVVSGAAHVPVRIGSTSAQFLSGKMTLRNLRVFNPRSFPEPLLLHVPLIAVNFDAGALIKGTAHFREVRVNLKEVIVIKNRDGKLNVDALQPSKDERSKAKESQRTAAKGQETKLKIDKLYLTVGRVLYKDYSGGGQPSVQTFDINIQDREYDNIDNPTALVSLIMFEALTNTAISRLAHLDVGIFKDGASGVLSKGLGLVGEGAEGVDKAAQSIFGLFK